MDWTIGSGLRVGGHRGASASAPENTMASFRRAEAAGVDYLEFDVRQTRDGVLVVFHDDRLERTTGGLGAIEELYLADVERLDAGSWFDQGFAGEHVPTLAEVLALVEVSDRLGATIEAKGAGTGGPIAQAIQASPARARLSICSSDASELLAAADVALTVPRLLIVDRDQPDADLLGAARAADANGVNVPLEWLDASVVNRLRDAGLLVAAGTVDDDAGIERCLDIGVDVCDSNRPEQTVPARDAASRAGWRSG